MQRITHLENSVKINVVIELVTADDYKKITKAKYFFNWNFKKKFGL